MERRPTLTVTRPLVRHSIRAVLLGVVAALIAGWHLAAGSGADRLYAVMFAAYLPLAVVAALWLRTARSQPVASKGRLRTLLVACGFGVATGAASVGIEWTLLAPVGRHFPRAARWYVDWLWPADDSPESIVGWALFVLIAVVLAPLTEELVFRGIALSALMPRIGVVASVAVTSIAFGVLHPLPFNAAVFGALAAVLALRAGLPSAMLAHAAANAGVLALGVVVPSATTPDRWLLDVVHYPWVGWLLLALGSVGVVLAFKAAVPRFATGETPWQDPVE